MAALTRELFISKYGEEEGIRRWDDLIYKRKTQNKLEGFVRRFGPEQGPIKYQEHLEKTRGKGSLEWYVKKYGEEEGSRRYYEKNRKIGVKEENLRRNGRTEQEILEIKERHRRNSVQYLETLSEEEIREINYKKGRANRVEYWMEKGHTREEAQDIISQRQNTSSLDKFIERYGPVEGKQRYIEVNVRKTKNWKSANGPVSKAEQKFFQALDQSIYRGQYKNVFYYNKRGPVFINESRIITPDVVDNNHKIIIEFFGDFWHMNPNTFSPEDINPVTKMTAQEKWTRDQERISFLETKGYHVIIVWESEFNRSPEQIIRSIINVYENRKNSQS